MPQKFDSNIFSEKVLSAKISAEDLKKKLIYILESKNKGLHEKYNDLLIPFKLSLFPLDIRKRFPGYATYTLELGGGWGEFALEYAKTNQDTLYVALDKKKYRIKKSVKEQLQKNIPNVRWMVCNLEWIFNGLFTKQSIDKIIINFPDPWPKNRHLKHRFVGPELIDELSRVTKPGGSLEFATDSWSYMQDVVAHFDDSEKWQNIHGKKVILPRVENRPISFFEDLKRSENEHIYIIQLEKLC
jgi:tRNA (guanine-N7-)-methyltransferase